MLCSEWVPSEWESDKNITIIHTTPVHQLTSGEDKSWNKTFLRFSDRSGLVWIRKCTSQNSSKQIMGWIRMWETTGDALFHSRLIVDNGLVIRSNGLKLLWFLSAVWTLILTAPIHCRASIAETLMQCYISPNLMKKQTHPNLVWPEDEHIFSEYSFLAELFL